MNLLTFTAGKKRIDIVDTMIVSFRETLETELPGSSVIATLDGKIHIVKETCEQIRDNLTK